MGYGIQRFSILSSLANFEKFPSPKKPVPDVTMRHAGKYSNLICSIYDPFLPGLCLIKNTGIDFCVYCAGDYLSRAYTLVLILTGSSYSSTNFMPFFMAVRAEGSLVYFMYEYTRGKSRCSKAYLMQPAAASAA